MLVRRREEGQNLVEFSMVLVFLFFVVFGVLDLGRAFFSVITISNAAREGARYLTTHRADNYDSYVGTIAATVKEANGSMTTIQSSDVHITGRSESGGAPVTGCVDDDGDGGCDSGSSVIVTVDYQFDPIMGWIMKGPINLSRSVEMIVP